MTYHVGERVVFKNGHGFFTGTIQNVGSCMCLVKGKNRLYKVRLELLVGPVRVVTGHVQTGLVTSVTTES